MRKKASQKAVAALVAALLLFSGCGKAAPVVIPSAETVGAPAAETPVNITAAPAVTPVPAAENTPEATEAPTPAPTDEEKWAALEIGFVTQYLGQDYASFHQLVKNPEALGIDESSIPVTLGRFDEETNREWIDFCLGFYEKLKEIEPDGLSRKSRIAYETVKTFVREEAAGEEWYGYFEPLAPNTGVHADLPLVLYLFRVETREDAEAYLTLLYDAPVFFESLAAYEKERAKKGLFMRESALDTVLSDIAPLTEEAGLDFLLESFSAAADKIGGLTEEERISLKEESAEAVLALRDGYKALAETLENLRAFCRTGVPSEEDQRFFRYMLSVCCGENVSPDAAEELLLDTIDGDWQTAYDDSVTMSVSPDKFDLEADVTAGSPEENLEYLKALFGAELPAVELPEVTFVTVPESLQGSCPSAAYLVAPLDEPEKVTVLVNPAAGKDLLLTLAHECLCGHMYQYAAARTGGIPLSQQLLEETAYAEAFAQMGEILAAGSADAFPRELMRYKVYEPLMESGMMALSSILVNGRGYTETQFEKYAGENFGYPKYTADYIYSLALDMPLYFLPYAYGIARLRELQAESGLGVKEFYEACFGAGPVRFDILDEILRGEL